MVQRSSALEKDGHQCISFAAARTAHVGNPRWVTVLIHGTLLVHTALPENLGYWLCACFCNEGNCILCLPYPGNGSLNDLSDSGAQNDLSADCDLGVPSLWVALAASGG